MLNNYEARKMKKLVKNISDTRKRNNLNWMKILELAVIYAPDEALKAMEGIYSCDTVISDDFKKLVEALRRTVGE